MGMSIDAHIRGLVYLKKCGVFPFSDTRTGIIVTDESLEVAIDIMRKYKMIEDIIEWKNYDNLNTENYYGDYLRICDIRKVLEDGNED